MLVGTESKNYVGLVWALPSSLEFSMILIFLSNVCPLEDQATLREYSLLNFGVAVFDYFILG